jgi:tetratricopeptide (TPR) repeat protein
MRSEQTMPAAGSNKKKIRVIRSFAIAGFLVLWMFAGARLVLAQHEGHESMKIGWVPGEILTKPVTLRQGIGTVHDPVTTSSPEAQAFYDQGVAYLHSFVPIEAVRSFHQALRLDPSLAMAYIGLTDAYLSLQAVPAAHAAFEKAQALSPNVTDRERARITIWARRLDYLDSGANLQQYFAYRQAITQAQAVYPDDPWLWIERGFADEGNPYAHGQNGGPDTIAFYEKAIALSPDTFVAHHYLEHTLENLGLTKQALEQGEIYARMAPAVAHAQHMYGHELRRLGRTEEAIQQFLKAGQIEDTYYRAENIPPKYDWHHAHNLFLLATCYQSLGQMKAAETAFREAFAEPGYTDLAEFDRRAWPEFLLDRGRPQEALEASQELIKSKSPLGRFAGHTMAGRALLEMDRLEDAKRELALEEQEGEKIPVAVLNSLPGVGQLHAEILLREKKWDEGNPLMKQIEQKIDSALGPDAWSEALFELESIGRVARKVGDWDLAESTARMMIQHDPTYAGGHFLLGYVEEHKGDAAAAQQQFATGDKLWTKPDPGLTRPTVQNP